MTNAVIYVRISSDRTGEGLQVERQRKECQELADRLGWDVVGVRTDNDVSAYSGKARPGYTALLEDLGSGAANAVLAWHTDRLYRRPVDLIPLIDLAKAKGVKIHTVKAGLLDLSTPTGVLVAEMLASVSKFEIAHAVERMESRHRQRAAAGKIHGGSRPFGWQADRIHRDPAEAAEILQWAVHVLAGGSLGEIVRDLNDRGVLTSQQRDLDTRIEDARVRLTDPGLMSEDRAKLEASVERMRVRRENLRWNKQQVRAVLVGQRLAGWRVHRGRRTVKGEWEPILSEDVHLQLVALLTDSARFTGPAIPERRHLLSGLALCAECETPVTVKTDNRRNKRSYWCGTCGMYRTKEPIDEAVETYIIERLRFDDPADANISDTVDEVRLEFLQAKRRATVSIFSGDDSVTPAELKEILAGLDAEMAAEQARIGPALDARQRKRILDLADPDEFPGYTLARKRSIIDARCMIRLKRQPPGRNGFDPESVIIIRR